MRELGREAKAAGRVYLTGGACAVLLGWRTSTVDVDIQLIPDRDELLRALPRLKESLQLNVELASPSDFIPPLPGWEDRSPWIQTEGLLSFHHYDFYAQALAKIERDHNIDREDVAQMIAAGLVQRERLLGFFQAIEPQLYKYPAIDPVRFRRAVATTMSGA